MQLRTATIDDLATWWYCADWRPITITVAARLEIPCGVIYDVQSLTIHPASN